MTSIVDLERRLNQAINEVGRLRVLERIYYKTGTWTPTWTNLTTTGAPTYTGVYYILGPMVFFTVKITANGGTTASTAASTRINNLPIAAVDNGICGAADDGINSLGNGYVSSSLCWTPTWSARSNTIIIQGWYRKS